MSTEYFCSNLREFNLCWNVIFIICIFEAFCISITAGSIFQANELVIMSMYQQQAMAGNVQRPGKYLPVGCLDKPYDSAYHRKWPPLLTSEDLMIN